MSLADRLAEFHDGLDGDFVAAVEANRFVERMEAEHPDELREWMRANAVRLVTQSLAELDQRDRTAALRHAGRRAFANVAERIERGEVAARNLLAVRFVVDDDDTRRPLGEMTRADCYFAADAYRDQSRRAAMREAFLRECGKRAGQKRVAEALGEAAVERLWRNLIGDESADVMPMAA